MSYRFIDASVQTAAQVNVIILYSLLNFCNPAITVLTAERCQYVNNVSSSLALHLLQESHSVSTAQMKQSKRRAFLNICSILLNLLLTT